jgi:hypothetical protein
MPAVGVVSETEAAVSVSLIEGVGVGVAAETESVTAVVGGTARRVLDEALTDGDVDHLADHEALAALHNAFDLRTVPSVADALFWDGTAYTASPPVSPYVGTWLDALFVRPDTVHVNDDEFVGTTIDPAWTETVVAGTTTWTQSRGRLSVQFYGQSTAPQMSTILMPLSASYPLTIETAMQSRPLNASCGVGLCFANGTTSASGLLSALYQYSTGDYGYQYFMAGTLADGNVVGNIPHSLSEQPHPVAFEYMRLVWVAANSFKFLVSHDGVSWANYLGTYAMTLSPTHFGMTVTSWGVTTPQMASFEYVRVTQSDLS